ncbi:MAG: Ig-like domain-containing protein [Chloroflexi bacterium]|nr:Ig-like domain-containing protein [Chloroflexota bacterium]MCY3583158.1 Ig-like domain-containing protein [Chloroflexota bacterium]MCY3715730.1 Ig-like domain-containing protein [Chloroflexota bacterium]MDE2649898.1 Ig-like domain-containing protein [Chloroflexota bacterium]MXX49505.1 hypothetical protein [Chloroflexota bacterium]
MPASALPTRLLLFCALWLGACSLAKPSPTPLPSPTPAIPQVQILFPAHNQQVIEGLVFDIDILARDAAQGIARIELHVDGELAQAIESEADALNEFRVTMNWFAKGIGWHKFEARAYRPNGEPSQAAIIALEVVPAP